MAFVAIATRRFSFAIIDISLSVFFSVCVLLSVFYHFSMVAVVVVGYGRNQRAILVDSGLRLPNIFMENVFCVKAFCFSKRLSDEHKIQNENGE